VPGKPDKIPITIIERDHALVTAFHTIITTRSQTRISEISIHVSILREKAVFL